MKNRRGYGLLAAAIALWSCSLLPPQSRDPSIPQASSDGSAITALRSRAEKALSTYAGREEGFTVRALQGARFFPAAFKRPMALQGLTDPWNGLGVLEEHALSAAALAGGNGRMPAALIDALEGAMHRVPAAIRLDRGPTGPAEDQIAFLTALLEQASVLREQALRQLDQHERQFVFDHAAVLVERFIPQRGNPGPHEIEEARADRRFAHMVDERVDYGALMAVAKVLGQLDDGRWLAHVETVFRERRPVDTSIEGITGELLLAQETTAGLIVIGGPGRNTYELDHRVALVLDVGGDDLYRGAIAAAGNSRHGVAAVIDLRGNDMYDASPFGLATGRLGVGLLIDRSGDDRYHLRQGSGGTGFAGIGLLRDTSGRDHYAGDRFTQGAAIGGLGLLIDEDGDDTYTSFGYAIGFGGPLGLGAVFDLDGDDSYQCGDAYASGYNAVDAPDGRPGEPNFQYDAFGIGAGAGIRILSRNAEQVGYGLAGGWGLVVDLKGNDRYRSSNFSQGVGYFFGMGAKLDLAGNDEHIAARYGHGAAAHYGVGLFIDRDGQDLYSSTGPFYNGGTAWDLSVSLGLDAGAGDDVYDLRHSDGLGRADHRSWSVFLEEGGNDRYLVPHGMGAATDGSLSAFMDFAGEDEYVILARAGQKPIGNGRISADGGSVFVDY